MKTISLPSINLTLTDAAIDERINQQVEALGHIVHVRPTDVALRIDAEHTTMSNTDYDSLLRYLDTKLFFRRAAHFDRAYA